MKSQSKLQCEVCKQEDSVGVACVPGIPYSAAYGKECLARGADPYSILRASVACNGGVQQTADWFLDGMTFHKGTYMTLRDALRLDPITEEELNFEDAL